jgi:photosystem II stability/assembly factor-like uncharacterized protein
MFSRTPLSLWFLCSALVPATARTAVAQDPEHLQHNVFAQLRWRELGPVQSGGRFTAIAVHPQKSQVFWVAAASGGLWYTENGGVSFAPQFQDAYSISIGDVAVAPSNGDVLYVGTGEANNQRSSYWGNGVHRSDDGGKTWRHLGLDGTDHIARIAVHPQNPDDVWVAALGALYTANDTRGLYHSTDGGKTWQRPLHQGPDTGCVDVVLDPLRPSTVFAATYERRRRAWHFEEGGLGSRLWKSTDAGASWTQLGGGLPEGRLGRIGLAMYSGDSKILYASIENLNPAAAPAAAPTAPPAGNDPKAPGAAPDAAAAPEVLAGDPEPAEAALPDLPAELLADPVAFGDAVRRAGNAQDPERRPRAKIQGGEIYRSDDGGTTWQKRNSQGEIGGNPGYYYGQIRIDPKDPELVYVLSVQVHRSRDGGRTWTPGRNNREHFANTLHSDHHVLWLDPQDGQHALLGNDGGLAQTWDGGQTWDHLAHVPITQYYTVAVDQRVPYRIYGGLQDNGTWGFPSEGPTSSGLQATDAYRIDGGDGFHAAVDPSDPDVVYSESQFGGMSRQNLRTGERKSIQPKAPKGEQPLRFNWCTPLLLSPHNPHTVYTASQFVHRSRDRGNTWSLISPDLSHNDAEKKKGNVPHCTVTTLAESPRREGWLWAGTDDGRVWTSKDGGQRWQELTDRFPVEVRGLWVSRIEASPHAETTAFVAWTGYREDRRSPFLFRTDDGGETWLPIEHDLPMEPINVVRQHPRNPNVLLVGTEMGAYVSVDDGAQWFRLGSGLPRVAVHDLVVHPRESHVLVGTHGRGVWALDAAALETLKTELLQRPFAALPPSDGVLLRRPFSPGNQGARTWSAANPFTAATFRYVLAEDTSTKVTIQVQDASGRTVWSQDGPTKAGYHEVAWQAGRQGRPGQGQGGPGAGGPGAGGLGSGGLGSGQAPGGGAPGGQNQGGQNQAGAGGFPNFGRGAAGMRPGQWAVVLQHGDTKTVFPFRVHDRRGPSAVVGGVAGTGAQDDADDAEAEQAHRGR